MSFRVKKYTLKSDKVTEDHKIKLVFLSDLHLTEHGRNNCNLLKQIQMLNPDAVLVGGDMVIGNEKFTTDIAEDFFENLSKQFPIYYALGNHETRLKLKPERYGDVYQGYKDFLVDHGIHILDNEVQDICIKDTNVRIYGLSLPLRYYKRFTKESLLEEDVSHCLGKLDSGYYNILLAHHPRYAEGYFAWGADLILSGHIHGGVMRLGKHACISPDFQFFPKYGYGKYERNYSKLLISGGLGEHTIPFRLFNPKELVYIEIAQEVPNGDSR